MEQNRTHASSASVEEAEKELVIDYYLEKYMLNLTQVVTPPHLD